MHSLTRLAALALVLAALSTGPAAAQTLPGRLDPSFSTDGVAFGTVADSEARDVIVDGAGLVTVAGRLDLECGNGTAAFIARYTRDGDPLTSFGQNGVARFSDDCDTNDEADAVVGLPDGSLLLVTYSQVLGNEVQRVLPTGVATCRTTFGSNLDIAKAAVTPEGDVVVTAAGPAVGGVVKIDVNYGSGACPVATEFGTAGTAFLAIPGRQSVDPTDVAVQPDGRIVVTGYVVTDSTTDAFLARLTPAGAFDPFFGYDGVGYVLSDAADDRFGESVATGPTGDIVVVGGSQATSASPTVWYVQRHRFDGIPDPTFSDDSVVLFAPGPGLDGFARSVTIDDDNRVVLVGEAVEVGPSPRPGLRTDRRRGAGGGAEVVSWAIARLRPDGGFDGLFGQNGITVERPFGLQGELEAVDFQPGGNPIVAGYVALPTGGEVWAVARYQGKSPVAAEGAPAAEATRLTVAPNPAVGHTTLTVERREAGPVRVAVVDALGREVAVVHDGLLGAGTHRLPVRLGGLAPGVYVVRAAGSAPVRLVVAR